MENIVTKEANIKEINLARREAPAGDKVDDRLDNNHNHELEFEYGANGEYMAPANDDRLNDERSVSDNPGKNSRSLDGKFTDSSRQKATVPDDFYNNNKSEEE